jgi:hypothetical protein
MVSVCVHAGRGVSKSIDAAMANTEAARREGPEKIFPTRRIPPVKSTSSPNVSERLRRSSDRVNAGFRNAGAGRGAGRAPLENGRMRAIS